MFKFLAILLIITISGCSSRCVLNKDLSRQCDSIKDLQKIGMQNVRSSLTIKSDGVKQQIQSNTFGRHTRLNTLFFINSVSDIQPQPFSGLIALRHIKFENCDLATVKNSWFNRLTSLETVEIINSKVASLQAGSFERSYSLKYLRIEGNNISRLVANSFSDTTIEKLILNRNQIRVIEESALAKMPYLKMLWLHENFLTSFNSKVILGVEVSSLQELFLSNNKLESFTERVFSSVEVLHLQNNRLNFLPPDFSQNFPKLFEISIFGNPWQCGCYFEIVNSLYHNNVKITCAGEYANGQRPVCVVAETNANYCMEQQNANNFYEIYIEGSKNYPEEKCNEEIQLALMHNYTFNSYVAYNF